MIVEQEAIEPVKSVYEQLAYLIESCVNRGLIAKKTDFKIQSCSDSQSLSKVIVSIEFTPPATETA